MIGANETQRVKYRNHKPKVKGSRRRAEPSQSAAKTSPSSARSTAGRALSKSKREERERRQRVQRRKRTLLLVVAVAAVVALIAGGIWVYRSPFLTVETVAVEGASRLTDADVLGSAALPAEETLLRLRPRRVESRLEQNPWIADATVRRELPDTVRIAVVERRPAASVVVDEKQWLVSEDGVFLEERSEEDTASYVLVEEVADLVPRAGSPSGSTELNNAIAALEGLSDELRQQVQTVVAPTIDKTVLRTKDGVEIFVGEAQEMPVKDEIARRILAEQEGVVYINVRTIDRPTWRGLDE